LITHDAGSGIVEQSEFARVLPLSAMRAMEHRAVQNNGDDFAVGFVYQVITLKSAR
jgi:hypothetical protein